jgi:hypothetical protein
MYIRNLIAAAISASMIVSCGQNSTKSTVTSDSLPPSTEKGTVNSGPSSDMPVNTNTTMASIEVPEATKQAFQQKYPTATNVKWNQYDQPYSEIDWSWAGWPALDTSDYTVTYTDNGTEYNAWYDKNNNWVGTVYNLRDEKSLPQSVVDMLNKDFNGYTVTEVSQENDKNRTAYEIRMEKDNGTVKLLVDENGKTLKKVMNSDGVKTKDKSM